MSSESFKVDCNNALHSFDHADGHFHLMGCMLSAASCNKWWMEEILKTKEFPGSRRELLSWEKTMCSICPISMGERSPHNEPGPGHVLSA